MENLFYDDTFLPDVESICEHFGLDNDEDILNLPDDWKEEFEESEKRPMFQVREIDLHEMIHHVGQWHDDKYPEDSDSVNEDLEKAITQSVDLEKLNSLIPKLYYQTSRKITITKADLLNELNLTPKP